MAIVAIVLACMAGVMVILNLLPVWTPLDISGAVADLAAGPGSDIFAGLGWLNLYVPVGEMLFLLGVQVTFWATIRVVQYVVWLLQLFHVAGGGD